MKYKWIYIIGLVMLLSVTACGAPTQTTDTGVTIESKVDTNVYTIELHLEQEEESYSQGHAYLSGSSFNGYGSVSGRYWEEGKGILRGTLISVNPNVDVEGINVGQPIVIKTTDYKVMGLVAGDTVEFACTIDYEPVCAKSDTTATSTGDCVDIWEFDFCRIINIESVETSKPTDAP